MSDKKKTPFVYTESRVADERGSSSQRTGESSQLNIEACTVISARNKATAFSLLNRLSDSTATQPQAEEKVGPWSFTAH